MKMSKSLARELHQLNMKIKEFLIFNEDDPEFQKAIKEAARNVRKARDIMGSS